MTLADVRDYIDSLQLADTVYMGKMPDKQEHSIGVYNSKHQYPYHVAIGGPELETCGTKYVTLLVHWSRSPRETETAAAALFEAVRRTREAAINQETIQFIQPLYELQDLGTDDAGVYEMAIEAAVVFSKKKEINHEQE